MDQTKKRNKGMEKLCFDQATFQNCLQKLFRNVLKSEKEDVIFNWLHIVKGKLFLGHGRVIAGMTVTLLMSPEMIGKLMHVELMNVYVIFRWRLYRNDKKLFGFLALSMKQ